MKRKAIVMTFMVPNNWKPHEFGMTVMGCIEDCDQGIADKIEVFLGATMGRSKCLNIDSGKI